MPVTDAGLRARILYAETRDLAEDKPGDLKLIRDRLAELIAASDAGVGFAGRSIRPCSILARRTSLPPGRNVAVTANPSSPMTIDGKAATIAFFAESDPSQNRRWCATIPGSRAATPSRKSEAPSATNSRQAVPEVGRFRVRSLPAS